MSGVVYDFLFWLNAFIVILWALFLMSVLKPRWSLQVSLTGFTLCTCGALAVAFLMPYSMIQYRQLVGAVVLVAAALVFFSDKWTKVLFAVLMMYMDVLLCEILILAVLPGVTLSESWIATLDRGAQVGLIVVYVFILGTLLFLTSFLFNRKTSRLNAKEWLLFSIFPVSQVFLLVLFLMMTLRADTMNTAVWQIVTGLVCIGVDVGLFFAVKGMSQRAELAAKNRLLAEQIDAQKQHYAALAEQYGVVRKMRHDIANHVHTIQLLLESGDTGAAKKYAEETLAKHTFHSSLGTCENPVVDAFLFDRTEKAEQQQIAMKTSVALPNQTGIADTDLIAVFGNLLDNAAEACMELPPEQRWITLGAAVRDGYLRIHMENACLALGKRAHAARIEGLNRGLGGMILGDVAQNYHGHYSAQAEESKYITDLVLLTDDLSL